MRERRGEERNGHGGTRRTEGLSLSARVSAEGRILPLVQKNRPVIVILSADHRGSGG